MDGDEIDIDGVREMVRHFRIDKPMKVINNVSRKGIFQIKIINKNEYIKIEDVRNGKGNKNIGVKDC